MSKDNQKMVYKVMFEHQEKIYELYCSELSEGALMGFIELEGIIFTPSDSLVVNPGEEKVRLEFQGVKRTYVPMHSILRIDEIEKRHLAAIHREVKSAAKVTPFPKTKSQQLAAEESSSAIVAEPVSAVENVEDQVN